MTGEGYNAAKAANGMDFDSALTRMRDWAGALEDWVQASDNLIAAYEAATWIRNHRARRGSVAEQRRRDLTTLKGPSARYEPLSITASGCPVSELSPKWRASVTRRQVYANDYASADIVVSRIESLVSARDRTILRLLANHHSTRSVAHQVDLS